MPASNFEKSNKTFILSKNNLGILRGQTFGCEGSGCRALRNDFPGHEKGPSRFRETIFSVVSKHLWLSKFDDGTQGILSRATRGIHSGVFNTTDLADVDPTMQKSPVCYLDAQQ